MNDRERVRQALALASQYGGIDGEHHKAWVIDQIVRVLTDCPTIKKQLLDCNKRPYTADVLGESEEYKKFVQEQKAGEDGPETYEWDEGIAP